MITEAEFTKLTGGLFHDSPGEDGLPEDAEPFERLGHRAVWSDDFKHRYILWRDWQPKVLRRYLQVIGLNPSTANETDNDPTLRRVIALGKRLGMFGVVMTNLFSFRSTDPAGLKSVPPDGHRIEDNNEFLLDAAKWAKVRVAAWGTHGSYLGRGPQVAKMLADAGYPLHCLGRNADGSPKHPLYLPDKAQLEPYGLPE